MATIEEMENQMTVFFNKRLGKIMSIATGIQDFNTYYGEQAEDYSLIWDSVVLIKNDYVIQHQDDFIIENKQLKLINNDLQQFING